MILFVENLNTCCYYKAKAKRKQVLDFYTSVTVQPLQYRAPFANLFVIRCAIAERRTAWRPKNEQNRSFAEATDSSLTGFANKKGVPR